MARTPAKGSETSSKSDPARETRVGTRRASFLTIKDFCAAAPFAIAYEAEDFVGTRDKAWKDYYDPKSPAALHLAERCINASLQHDRIRIAQDLIVSNQVRKAPELWQRERRELVMGLVDELRAGSIAASRKLRDTSQGCQWMLNRWKELRAEFVRVGWWSRGQLLDVIRLLGHDPRPDQIRNQPGVWRTWLFNYLLVGERADDTVASLHEDWNHPEEMRTEYGDHGELKHYPGDDAIRAEFLRIVDHQIQALEAEANRLYEKVDHPDLAEATGRALLITDTKVAHLILRAQTESRNNFDRAYASLLKTLCLDDALNAADLAAEAEAQPSAA